MIKGNSGCHGNREAQHKMRVTGGVSGVFLQYGTVDNWKPPPSTPHFSL